MSESGREGGRRREGDGGREEGERERKREEERRERETEGGRVMEGMKYMYFEHCVSELKTK